MFAIAGASNESKSAMMTSRTLRMDPTSRDLDSIAARATRTSTRGFKMMTAIRTRMQWRRIMAADTSLHMHMGTKAMITFNSSTSM